MRYAEARWELYQREEVYRIYVTDGIRALGGFKDSPRYVDLFEPQHEETRTPEEIINHLRSGLECLGG